MTGIVRFAAAVLLVAGMAWSGTAAAPLAQVATPVDLSATALYMGGTGHTLTIPGPDPPEYIDRYVAWAYGNFVGPSQLCGPACTQTAVFTPSDFWPDTGLGSLTFDASVALGLANLDECLRASPCLVTDPPFTSSGERTLADTDFTVFGYSQSGTVASIQKSDLIAHPPAGTVSFVLLANPNRPNGGILERFVGVHIPILNVTFNGATVTNSPQPTPLTTVDVNHQYDPVADFPTNPLNLLADLNVLIGLEYEHPEFGSGTPVLQGQFQDTTYYLVPTVTGELPLIRPLNLVPWVGPLLAVVLDPPLRVLVETGYDRTINPGAPTPAKYLYVPNPITTTLDFLAAIPTGWDNGIAYLTGDPSDRPFGTTPQVPYGVGGPPVNAGAVDPYGPPTPLVTVPRPLRAAPSPSGTDPRGQRVSRRLPGPRPGARTQTVAVSRSAAPNRKAASSTGPFRKRAWSAQ